ncbi:MAG TPA: hypothetical protein DEA08_34070 [Planctomycetes bacterium]|nr:hypothetical protein [Planctomycetota bacterium]
MSSQLRAASARLQAIFDHVAWRLRPAPEPEPEPTGLWSRARAALGRDPGSSRAAPRAEAPVSPELLKSLRAPTSQDLRGFAAAARENLTPPQQRPPRPTRGARLRARLLLSFLILGFGGLAYRLYQVQLVQHEDWRQRARAQHKRVHPIPPERGRVLLRDDGRLVPLAVSVRRGSLMVEGREDRDVDDYVARLKQLLPDLSGEEETEVRRRLATGRAFYFRRRELEPEEIDRINEAARSSKERLPRSHVEVEPVRTYPFGQLASQVLGLMAPDRTGGTGIEARCEAYLRGTPGEREVTIDRRRRELVGMGERIKPAIPGGDVVLSLDRTLQQVTEEELARLGEEHEPEGAAVVVVDPRTGDVLAMASWPTFDPRDPGKDFAQGQHNRAIQHGYEPGSTMKPLLVGMAWQLGLGGPDRLIDCPRRYKVPGRRKPVVDSHTVGTVPELEVLVQSSNSGAVKISSRMTNEQVRQTLAAFGLGRRTRIPLPAEIPGDTRSLDKMTRAHLAAVAQGYAVMVTPLQMALAYGALANGGTLFAPRLVVEVRDRNGKTLHKNEPRALARPLTSRVSHGALREALVQVVNGDHGTAKRARSKRYTIAGKTGTTKKIENGRYHEREVVASFAGYAPAEDPRLAFAVVAWGPSTKERRAWGGTVAAPTAGRIAERALRLWRVPASPGSEEAKKAAEAKQAGSQQARSH